METLKDLLRRLTGAEGVSGDEKEIARVVTQELEKYAAVRTDALGSVIGEIAGGGTHIMLDAHTDRIGFVVTAVDPSGFLRIASVGGNDERILAAAEVTVYGKEPLYGVIISTPPHLSAGEDKDAKPIDQLAIDIGLPYDDAAGLVSPGDRVIVNSRFCELKNGRVASAALDDRAGVAVVLRALELLHEKEHNCKITAVFSSREEVGGQGAETAAFGAAPDKAIAVDVSFAHAPSIAEHKASPLGGGVIISYAPVLSFTMADKLKAVAEKNNLPYSVEVGGRDSGSNGDSILSSGAGVETAVLFVPQRNMHSAVEIVDLQDIETAAQLIAHYILEESGSL
ncbi:MAG: M20/M25/M40 family metallo-hydrolase [Oscillospiraceae bacterium]|jgi:endoglucanase|nr:M20/M25/M40 family metallo-hydrolase [Oscillospiraceae bacterium]